MAKRKKKSLLIKVKISKERAFLKLNYQISAFIFPIPVGYGIVVFSKGFSIAGSWVALSPLEILINRVS